MSEEGVGEPPATRSVSNTNKKGARKHSLQN
jgi:hypothetical protein